MANPKDILVVTTSSIEGLKVKEYLKPVSAHIVAGTNLFSDFFASFSDVFGGRSQTYQKQLTSLYNEAIERIKIAAHEIGANCVIGLNIDMDEISGKGKSMFMLTAIGTAVTLEKEDEAKTSLSKSKEKFENVSVDRIINLRTKKAIIEKASLGTLKLDEENWDFIISNQIDEVFPYITKKFANTIANEHNNVGSTDNFFIKLTNFIDSLPEDKKVGLIYSCVNEESDEQVVLKISDIIKELNLLDLKKTFEVLNQNDFSKQKLGLRLLTYDKSFYNKGDIIELKAIKEFIQNGFGERGTRTMKKQLLSSKEKEVWTCECNKTNNDIDNNCENCYKDINGFITTDIKPLDVCNLIEQKIELIAQYVE